jgi:hypothetical protein
LSGPAIYRTSPWDASGAPPFSDENSSPPEKKLDFTVGAAFCDCKKKTPVRDDFQRAGALRAQFFPCIRASPR